VTSRKTSRKVNDKHARILDAAIVEIARQGYHRTTVARIARRAGVADGTIYLYFKSKEDVLVAVFDRAMDRFISQGIMEMNTGAGAAELLYDIVRLHLEQLGEDHDLAVILQVELRHSLHFLDMFSRTRLRDYLEIIAGVIKQGQNERVFRSDLEPMFAAKLVFGVLDQLATDWVLSDRNYRLGARAEEANVFLKGALALHDTA